MPFRKNQSVPTFVECDNSKFENEKEKSKLGRGKGYLINASFGSFAKIADGIPRKPFRSRSANDLQAKALKINVDIDNLPPLKPLRGCLSNGQLSSMRNLVTENSAPLDSQKRNVSFGNLIIREHPRALCGMSKTGPMLALDWYIESDGTDSDDSSPNIGAQCKTYEVSVEEYEDTRLPRRHKPPVISKAKRERLLKKFGITDADLLRAEKERDSEREAAKKEESNILDVMGRAVRKTMKGGSSDVQRELDDLMKRAAEAEQIKKLQMEKYLAEQRKQLLAACEAQINKERTHQMNFTGDDGVDKLCIVPSDATYSTKSSSYSDAFLPCMTDMEDDVLEF